MSIPKNFLMGLAAVLMVLPGGAGAANQDVEGSEDHPLISRFPGSTILFYHQVAHDEYVLPLGKAERERDENLRWVYSLTDSVTVEGKITRIQYEAPEDRSTLEIFRSYESALLTAGFDILFSGSRDKLGSHFSSAAYSQADFSVGVARSMRARGNLAYYLHSQEAHQRYLAARLSRPEGEVYVAVFVSVSIHKPAPAIQVDVIEPRPMETGLITAGSLYDEMRRTGRARVYDILFETGSYDILPGSEAALKEIAKLLADNPDVNLYVVGHTDDTGSWDLNMELSQKRAESVVEWLKNESDLEEARLHPVGVGPVAPVSSNETEEGRARNRRVELVKQLK